MLVTTANAQDVMAALPMAALRLKYRKQAPPPYIRPTLRGAASELWGNTDHEAIICGPAETGKTWAGLSWVNSVLWDNPGAQGVLLRKTYASLHNTAIKTYKRILGPDTPVRAYGGEKAEWFDYPNGSRLSIVGMDNPSKVLSGEVDIVYMNQAEELAFDDYQILLTRTTGRGAVFAHPQVIGDCNPDKIGHWILERQKTGHLKLLYSFHEDNPTLFDDNGGITEQGKRTMEVLDGLEGIPYKRLRLGQWGVPAGLIYAKFEKDKHTVPWFAIPSDWPRYMGLDFGGVNTAAIFIAEEPGHPKGEEQYIVYREYHAGGKTSLEHTADLLEDEPTIPICYGGAKSEGQWRREFSSGGEVRGKKIPGLPIREPKVSEVEVGIGRGISLFSEGRIKVLDTCKGFISDLQSYSRKLDSAGEPTQEIADKAKWHRLDAYRYIATRLADKKRVGTVL